MPLIINDKIISEISGPVFLEILQPNSEIFKEYKDNGTKLPLFMIFGDYHYLNGKPICDKEEQNKSCYEIYSKEFLQLLDSLSTPKSPVDFSIETFYTKADIKNLLREESILDIQEQLTKKKQDTMIKLREKLIACYLKELRGTKLYSKYCPTSKIRWHFADARQATNSNFLENLVSEFDEYEDNILKYNPLNAKLLYDKVHSKEGILKIVSNLQNKYGKLYKPICKFHFLMYQDFEKAIDYFFDTMCSIGSSLIKKQIDKINYKTYLFSSIKQYAKYLEVKIKEDIVNSESFKSLAQNNDQTTALNEIYRIKSYFYALLHDYKEINIKKIIEFLTDDYNINLLSYVEETTTFYNNIFLDLYYICRSFKTPKNDVQAGLSIGYFGVLHSQNICHFLKHIFNGYEVIEKTGLSVEDIKDTKKQSNIIQGVKINNNINLNELLRLQVNNQDYNFVKDESKEIKHILKLFNIIYKQDDSLDNLRQLFNQNISLILMLFLDEERDYKLKSLRKYILGDLYEKCKDGVGVTENDLRNRISETGLKITFDDTVKICKMKSEFR